MPLPSTPTRTDIVLASVLRVLAPLVRLLVRSGVTYPVLAAELKRAFLRAAEDELKDQGMPRTASALTLLSGVHRRDVRTLSAEPTTVARTADVSKHLTLAAEVIAKWRHLHGDAQGLVPPLPRSEFDTLVDALSRDVRPRAVLEELKRLGAVEEDEAGALRLAAASFAPTPNFEAMAEFFAANVGDHASAAARNFAGSANFLDQAVFVDEITERSARQLQDAAVEAWQEARKRVMGTAQERYQADRSDVPARDRRHRARFGVYFYSEPEEKQ